MLLPDHKYTREGQNHEADRRDFRSVRHTRARDTRPRGRLGSQLAEHDDVRARPGW